MLLAALAARFDSQQWAVLWFGYVVVRILAGLFFGSKTRFVVQWPAQVRTYTHILSRGQHVAHLPVRFAFSKLIPVKSTRIQATESSWILFVAEDRLVEVTACINGWRVTQIVVLAVRGARCRQRVFGGGLWIIARVCFQVPWSLRFARWGVGLFIALVIQVHLLFVVISVSLVVNRRQSLSYLFKNNLLRRWIWLCTCGCGMRRWYWVGGILVRG